MASWFHPKAKIWIKGRSTNLEALRKAAPLWLNKKVIWIHAASYGEYEMAKPIVKELLQNPDIQIVISFYSASGFENVHFEDKRIFKIYLPIDLIHKQLEIIKLIKPAKVVFIKYEFWYNLLRALYVKRIPYYYTSLHLNKDSYVFNIISRPLLKLIKKSKFIYCHNTTSEQILLDHRFTNTKVIGDSRISQVIENAQKQKGQLTWVETKPTIILGSIIPSEYPMIKTLISHFPEYNYIIAPHDVDRASISALIGALNLSPMDYSQFGALGKQAIKTQVLIIDTLGDLRYLYRNADVAYVGAGFDKGPHNVLEPLVYGIPTICGSNIDKFPMAQFLEKEELLFIIKQPQDLTNTINKLLEIDQTQFKVRSEKMIQEQEINLDELIAELISD